MTINLQQLKEILRKFDLSEIKTTTHGFQRMQDKKRRVAYSGRWAKAEEGKIET